MCYTASQGTVTVPIQVQFDFYSTYTPQPTTGCTITADFVDKKSFSPPYRPRNIHTYYKTGLKNEELRLIKANLFVVHSH